MPRSTKTKSNLFSFCTRTAKDSSMSNAPEIPEPKDHFEMTVAVTIAIVAVILSWITSRGDDAKTNAIIMTNAAANKWGHFQSKSIKERVMATSLDLASLMSVPAANEQAHSKLTSNLREEIDRYHSEKGAIEQEAEKIQAEAEVNMRINDRCGTGCLLLQVAIVIGSMAVLARAKSLWIGCILLAAVGSLVGISSHFM
jgi:hypothetical protein